jgi:hypothetical protein
MIQEELGPKVLTWSQLELRKELIEYITNYVKLLESVVIIDYQKPHGMGDLFRPFGPSRRLL